MINDGVSQRIVSVIFRDATLREHEAACDLARVYPRLKVQALAADNPSPRAKYWHWQITEFRTCYSRLSPLSHRRRWCARWKIVGARANRPRGPTKLRSIYCVFSKVRSKADGKLQTAGIAGFNAQHPPGSWYNVDELEPTPPPKGKN